MKRNEKDKILSKKVNYFYDKSISIHIELVSGKWLNGKILDVKKDFFIIDEFKEGEQPVFYSEVKDSGISPYEKRGGRE